MTARLVHIDEADVLIGLDWRQAGGRFNSLALTYGEAGQGRIAWNGWTARSTDPSFIDQTPLLALVAERLAQDERSVCAVIGFTDGTAWTALFKAGRAVFGTEQIYEAHEAAITAGLAAAKGRLGSALYAYGIDPSLFGSVEASVLEAPLVSDEVLARGPRVKQIFTISRKAALWGGAGILTAAAIPFGFVLVSNLYSARPAPVEEYVLPARATWVLPPEAFLASCLAAHEAEWPNALGWQTTTRGCDAPRQGETQATAWRVQVPLTDGPNGNSEPARILRARMAEMMYAPWEFEKSISQSEARAARPISVNWVLVNEAEAQKSVPTSDTTTDATLDLATFTAEIEDAFAGVLDSTSALQAGAGGNGATSSSNSPADQSNSGQSGSGQSGSEQNSDAPAAPLAIRVELTASPEEVAPRLARLSSIAVTSLSWDQGQTVTLILEAEPQRLSLPEGEAPNA